ncbi:MAG: hypothetical protein ABJA66_17105 [Actinomycetota bacterium]
MKKTNSIFCVIFLSVLLAGNVFASGTGSSGIYSVLENITNTVVSFIIGDDGCTTRQCPNCKPTSEGGDCRPTNN